MPSKRILFDTNVLIRAISPGDSRRQVAIDAIRKPQLGGATLCICAQNMQEFRQVATRSQDSNGLGMSSSDVVLATNDFEAAYERLPETDAAYNSWRRIVETVGATGRANNDARIVAVAEACAVQAVITFEAAAFQRYGAISGIEIIDPTTV